MAYWNVSGYFKLPRRLETNSYRPSSFLYVHTEPCILRTLGTVKLNDVLHKLRIFRSESEAILTSNWISKHDMTWDRTPRESPALGSPPHAYVSDLHVHKLFFEWKLQARPKENKNIASVSSSWSFPSAYIHPPRHRPSLGQCHADREAISLTLNMRKFKTVIKDPRKQRSIYSKSSFERAEEAAR